MRQQVVRLAENRESISGKPPQAAVCEPSGSGSGDSGFRGLLEERFGADDPIGKDWCSVGHKWGYIFDRRKAKKLICIDICLAVTPGSNQKPKKDASKVGSRKTE